MSINLNSFDTIFIPNSKIECIAVRGTVLHCYGIAGSHYHYEYPTKAEAKEAYNNFKTLMK